VINIFLNFLKFIKIKKDCGLDGCRRLTDNIFNRGANVIKLRREGRKEAVLTITSYTVSRWKDPENSRILH
jgi:hypothetical protein